MKNKIIDIRSGRPVEARTEERRHSAARVLGLAARCVETAASVTVALCICICTLIFFTML